MEVDSNSLVSSVTGDDDAVSTVETGNSYSSTAGTNHHHHPSDALEKHGQWLTSIPRDEVEKLKGDKAYVNFLNAFEELKRAHHRMRQREANISECGIREGHCCQSFLHNFSDHLLIIFLLFPNRFLNRANLKIIEISFLLICYSALGTFRKRSIFRRYSIPISTYFCIIFYDFP